MQARYCGASASFQSNTSVNSDAALLVDNSSLSNLENGDIVLSIENLLIDRLRVVSNSDKSLDVMEFDEGLCL